MKSNLQLLQERMKQKLQSQQKTVAIPVRKDDGSVVVEERILCSTPGCKRVRRKGKPYCSRCTYKGIERNLRDSLPVDGNPLGKFNPVYASITEGQRSRTGDHDDDSILESYDTRKVTDEIRYTAQDLPLGRVYEEPPPVSKEEYPHSRYTIEEDNVLDDSWITEKAKEENGADVKAGSTVCKHMNEPFECKTCKSENFVDEAVDSLLSLNTLTTEKYYSRKQVAALLGTSSSSIVRWETKGATPLPKRLVHNNQYVYTEEHVKKMREYMTASVTAVPQQRQQRQQRQQGPHVQHESDIQETQNPGTFNLSVNAVKRLGKGAASGKRLNRIVAAKLGRLMG